MAQHTQQSYQERILKILIYIQNNLDADLSLEVLAAEAYFSPYHFHRIFAALTNESIKSYVKRLRLERATRDLALTNKPIIRIAERAGYDTQQSFHRAFKETYHMTPKDFRTQAKGDFEKIFDEKKGERTQLPCKSPENDLVKIVTLLPKKVAFVRHVGPYDNILQAWLQLTMTVGLPHLLSETSEKISIAYDAPETTPQHKLRFDACITIEGLTDCHAKGPVGIQTIQGGQYAVITHHGPLQTIENAYHDLFAIWLPHSGFEPADYPSFILHRKIPFQTPDSELITDIYLPIH